MDRAAALSTPLRNLRGWHLKIDCTACRLLRQVDVAALPHQDAAIGVVLPRLRCRRCRSAPAGIKLANAHRFTAQTVIEVGPVP
jgi:hypothetical protein